MGNAWYFWTKKRIVLCFVGGAHVQDMALIQVEVHLPDRGPFSNGCKVTLKGAHIFLISCINHYLNIVNELRHLAGEAQVIDIDVEKEEPQNWHLGNTTVNSGPVRGYTTEGDSLPPSCQPVLHLGSHIALVAHAECEPTSWAFCEGPCQRLCESPKKLHPRETNGHTHWTCDGRSWRGLKHKNFLDENRAGSCWWVVCHQEIYHPVLDDRLKEFSWDGGQDDGTEITCSRKETLFGDGADVREPKVQRNFGKKLSEPAAVSGFSFVYTSGSLQSICVNQLQPKTFFPSVFEIKPKI